MTPGQTLTHYEIISALGKGGMGEVYLAQDTRLKREVAIKVLPDSVRRDPERLKRFRREAEAAAKLNHPNIATIHSIEEDQGELFITMEYVDGKTLVDHIPSTGLDTDQFFEWFIPLSDALAHAHEHGRVHRDLKPANIMIRQDATPIILDFGLARIEESESPELDSHAPTQTMKDAPPSVTQGRSFLGTPAYMSPEQIEGKVVDARTDLFSLGVVMYEALTGQRPFKGDTVESIIARILEVEPEPMSEMKPVTPYQVWSVIRRCLEKDQDMRPQGANALHKELTVIWNEGKAGTLLVDASTVQERELAPDLPLRKYCLPLEDKSGTFETTKWSGLAISPDGARIAYIQNDSLWVRDLDQITPREIIDSVETKGQPGWSQDSKVIVYLDKEGIKKVRAEGGSSTFLCNSPGRISRFIWTDDENILLGNVTTGESEIYTVSAHGGDLRPFMAPDSDSGELGVSWPYILPDKRGLIFTVKTENSFDLVVQSGDIKHCLLSQDDFIMWPIYSPTGHLLYQSGWPTNRGIWAVAFDISTLKVTGNPFPVARDGIYPSIADDGTLVYRQEAPTAGGEQQLRWVDRIGVVGETIGAPRSDMLSPALSPDGRHVAVSEIDNGSRNIWVYNTVRGSRTRLRLDSEVADHQPAWSPTADQIVIDSDQHPYSDLIIVDADGSQEVHALELEHKTVGCPDWSSDGRFLLYHAVGQDAGSDIWCYDFTHTQSTRVFQKSSSRNLMPVLSPNGKFVAYQSDESGDWEIFVTRFPEGKGKWQISVDGGMHPRWNGEGNELFYVETGTNMLTAVSVETVDVFQMDLPQKLFNVKNSTFYMRQYDVTPDGQRFVVVQDVDTGEADHTPGVAIILVQNWFKEFEGRQ
jgi:eukaryotic-like serine/threonine-protein kinase